MADTHGLFDPAVRWRFTGVNHIFHAGDIGDRSVGKQLEQIVPIAVVPGNVDDNRPGRFLSDAVVELAGKRIALRHILCEGGKMTKEGRVFLDREHPDICIFGHTYQARAEWFGKMRLFNPGSAGPKRLSLPREVGLLTITEGKVMPN